MFPFPSLRMEPPFFFAFFFAKRLSIAFGGCGARGRPRSPAAAIVSLRFNSHDQHVPSNYNEHLCFTLLLRNLTNEVLGMGG